MLVIPPSYAIAHDPCRPVIHVEMIGLWTVELVDRYIAALDRAMEEQAQRTPAFCILVDGRTCPVQLAEVSVRFTEKTTHWMRMETGPLMGIAVMVGSILNKLQVERTFDCRLRVFREPDQALAWIEQQIATAPVRIPEEA